MAHPEPRSCPTPNGMCPSSFMQERDTECLVTGYKHRVLCLKSSEKKFVACEPSAEDTSQETLKFWVFQVCVPLQSASSTHRTWDRVMSCSLTVQGVAMGACACPVAIGAFPVLPRIHVLCCHWCISSVATDTCPVAIGAFPVLPRIHVLCCHWCISSVATDTCPVAIGACPVLPRIHVLCCHWCMSCVAMDAVHGVAKRLSLMTFLLLCIVYGCCWLDCGKECC